MRLAKIIRDARHGISKMNSLLTYHFSSECPLINTQYESRLKLDDFDNLQSLEDINMNQSSHVRGCSFLCGAIFFCYPFGIQNFALINPDRPTLRT